MSSHFSALSADFCELTRGWGERSGRPDPWRRDVGAADQVAEGRADGGDRRGRADRAAPGADPAARPRATAAGKGRGAAEGGSARGRRPDPGRRGRATRAVPAPIRHAPRGDEAPQADFANATLEFPVAATRLSTAGHGARRLGPCRRDRGHRHPDGAPPSPRAAPLAAGPRTCHAGDALPRTGTVARTGRTGPAGGSGIRPAARAGAIADARSGPSVTTPIRARGRQRRVRAALTPL